MGAPAPVHSRHLVLLAAAVLAMAACAAPPSSPPAAKPPAPRPVVAVDALETIVLLPDADGTVGSVTVSRGGKEVVLTEAWTAATVTGGADAISAHPVDRALVEKEFAAALAGMPVPPEHFVIYFEVAMTAPSEAMKGEIARIAEAIRARKAVDVSVIGHADNSGKEDANVAISRKRADAVAETLVSMGVSREIIDVASHGSRIPLIPGTGSIAEPRNRRVEVTVR